MTKARTAAGHHAEAATHHGHAANFHQAAYHNYRFGKDYAHAAFLALLAHGHGMTALDRARKAIDAFAAHSGRPLPTYLARAIPSETALAPAEHHAAAAEHHAAAAEHSRQSARYNDQAASHWEGKRYSQARHDAQLAHDHLQHATFHSNEAAKYHVAHTSSARPTAELVRPRPGSLLASARPAATPLRDSQIAGG